MIKTPLGTMIGGAFWTPGATIIGSSSKNLTQLIKSLFATGEQGFAYDPNDLTTLYQDAAGTIPVTAAGQPVGLVLDKSKGLVLGSEVFDDSKVTSFGGSTKISANTYKVYTQDSTASGVTVPVLALNKGWAVVDFEVIRQGGGTFRIDYGVGGIYQIPPNIGRYKLILFCNRGDSSIVFHRNTSPTDIEFKIHSIKELAGNHAYQTVSASRPILQRNATTGAYYLAFDGVDDFLQTNSINFTDTDKVSLFAGVRKLSDSTASMVVSTGSDYTLTGAFGLYCGGAAGAYSYSFAALGTAAQYLKPADAAPSSNVMTVKVNSAIPNITLVSNSMTKASVNLGSKIKLGNYPMYIGRNGGSSFPFNGHLYSLIGIGRLATDSETIALEKSIAKNVGVAI